VTLNETQKNFIERSILLHKDIVMKELYDRGYEKNVIDEWIDYI
jgi:hypothetical protein